MKIAVTGMLFASSLAGITAHATAHAYVNICYAAATHYRTNFNYEPPPWCWGSSWFRSTDGHWDRPLLRDRDQGTRPPPPAPPADVPPPPPGEDDEAPPAP